ncbi:MAG: trehalose-phosphatase [Candidatus Omnitrophica bacterium]|nr:trehalose-phosphatase [Candidatus Omnitrophota bacterium]
MIYLFPEWHRLKEYLKDRPVYIFLDYDGTLAPISKSPDKAFIPQQAKELLNALSKNPGYKLAIISGRALKDIKDLVGLTGIVYVGNHGLEIEGPKIKFESIIPPGFKRILKKIKDDLSKKLISIKGAFLEDKGYGLSLHYRLVNERDIPLVKMAFQEAVIAYLVGNKIKINSGKMMLEIRPPIEWNKGKAVLWLLARREFALKSARIFPIYIGDDVTDEDAFDALKNKGLTVFVGNSKKSKARYYLKNPQEVTELLRRIAELEKV